MEREKKMHWCKAAVLACWARGHAMPSGGDPWCDDCCACACACLMTGLLVLAASCALAGPGMLIAGGVLMAAATCEEIQIVPELARAAPPDNRLAPASTTYASTASTSCELRFAYTVTSRSFNGSLRTTCDPADTINATRTVAVCYPLANPGRYTAATDASGLRVVRHEIPLILLCVGAALTALVSAPLVVALIANAAYTKHASRVHAHA